MLRESLLELTALAGQAVVEAAASDEWDTADAGLAELLGRGDARQTRLCERRFEETREQILAAAKPDVELIRENLTVRWAGRLADFLEENPDAETDLRVLIQKIQVASSDQVPSAPARKVYANGDVSIAAAGAPGLEHPGTLAARSELAYSTGQAGDAAGARDQFAALLPVTERVLGIEHPDTLTSRHNLANFTGYAGDARAARDQFALLLLVSGRVFGA
ncbi:MAG: tetratricopeptide repeat protein, partial [Streptosporangiaceae bacterium]